MIKYSIRLARNVGVLITILISCFSLLSAQPEDNGRIYHRLLNDFFQSQEASIKEIKGSIVDKSLPEVNSDSTGSLIIELGEVEVNYARFAKDSFQRELKIPLFTIDSLRRRQILSYSDTLNLNQIKAIYKNSPVELKGDKPTFWARWIKPGLLVAGSVASIVSLFFIRSQ